MKSALTFKTAYNYIEISSMKFQFLIGFRRNQFFFCVINHTLFGESINVPNTEDFEMVDPKIQYGTESRAHARLSNMQYRLYSTLDSASKIGQ